MIARIVQATAWRITNPLGGAGSALAIPSTPALPLRLWSSRAQTDGSDMDLYAILGVQQDSTLTEIKRAYRARARMLHPDTASRRGGPPAGSGMSPASRAAHPHPQWDPDAFIRLSAAYDILANRCGTMMDGGIRAYQMVGARVKVIKVYNGRGVLMMVTNVYGRRNVWGLISGPMIHSLTIRAKRRAYDERAASRRRQGQEQPPAGAYPASHPLRPRAAGRGAQGGTSAGRRAAAESDARDQDYARSPEWASGSWRRKARASGGTAGGGKGGVDAQGGSNGQWDASSGERTMSGLGPSHSEGGGGSGASLVKVPESELRAWRYGVGDWMLALRALPDPTATIGRKER